MRYGRILTVCALGFCLAVGLSACGKQPAPANVNEVTNENANENGNENVNVPDVNDANANGNANANDNGNSNVNASLLDPAGDPDHDGLTNEQERVYHTDPLNPDTDGDGYTDGEEVATGYDPLKLPDQDPKVLSQLKPVSTPGIPAPPVRSTPLVAAQSFPFRATKADGSVTLRLESKVALTFVNYAIDFSGGTDNHGPSLLIDSTLQLLKGTYDKGKVWATGRDFTKGAHFVATSNTTGTITVFPAPTPPFAIDGRGEGGNEDAGTSYPNQIMVDFPRSGQYRLDLGVTKGKVKVTVENTDLVVGDKVYKEVQAISNTTIIADVAEGLHTVTVEAQGLAAWSLKVSKV